MRLVFVPILVAIVTAATVLLAVVFVFREQWLYFTFVIMCVVVALLLTDYFTKED